jgi:tripartite-type tricarboxylate transporter receptor subunit TctC
MIKSIDRLCKGLARSHAGPCRALMCALGYLLLATLACAPASAQEDWPSRPLRLVVPSSPGGGTDTYARVLSQALVDQLHQQIVIDNRPGASGNIGTEIVARAAGDGYTFLVSANAAITVNPALYPSLPFDMDRDFAPVTRGVSAALALIVPATSTNATLRDLIADARQNPRGDLGPGHDRERHG